MQRRILLVEDSRYQYAALADELEEKDWDVVHAQDMQDALYRLQEAKTSRKKLELAAIDLGIPPGKDNPLEGGIKLIREIRAMSGAESFPILAYTSLTPKEFDYSLAVKHLLAMRASFIYLRPMSDNVSFADLIEYVWMGFVLISPVPADFLAKAIPDTPDPLDEKHWETLSLLNRQLSYSQMADDMKITVEGVKARVTRIKEILIDAGELPYDAQNDELIQWYLQKRVRFSRP